MSDRYTTSPSGKKESSGFGSWFSRPPVATGAPALRAASSSRSHVPQSPRGAHGPVAKLGSQVIFGCSNLFGARLTVGLEHPSEMPTLGTLDEFCVALFTCRRLSRSISFPRRLAAPAPVHNGGRFFPITISVVDPFGHPLIANIEVPRLRCVRAPNTGWPAPGHHPDCRTLASSLKHQELQDDRGSLVLARKSITPSPILHIGAADGGCSSYRRY